MIRYYNRALLNFDFEKLLNMGYCWNKHKVNYKNSASTVTNYLTGQASPDKENVKKVRALLVKRFNTKENAIKFQLPELITWCGCEPMCEAFHREREAAYNDSARVNFDGKTPYLASSETCSPSTIGLKNDI